MPTSLPKDDRNQLARSILNARVAVEEAVRKSLESLAVHEADPRSHMSSESREFRNFLRAKARQLGDKNNPHQGTHEIKHLVESIAYERWNQMLFARFLAENDLLHTEDGIPVTLEECDELASDEGERDGFALAVRYASRMLPQIFRPEDPTLRLEFDPYDQQQLKGILDSIPTPTFHADDALGWVYQFWQAERKDEVNASGEKIGADELAPVTQLFTEDYMVSFLLDNSLGAWWAGKRLSEDDLRNAASEDELRAKAALPGVPLEYLRFVKEDDAWTPAAGTYEKWPEHLSELTTLDPCCGSGHFLVFALHMLVPMRMEMENLSAREACDRVLSENLHGLELDQRCVALAAFALALAAWKFPDASGYRPLPELHLACSGLSVGAAKEEWQELALDKQNLRIALNWMHDVFNDAPVLGSLINPATSDAAKVADWDELSAALGQALQKEQNEERHEAGVVAQGLAKA
ncbi:MAG: DNA methyltransferase, partial [Opitutales bacterium]